MSEDLNKVLVETIQKVTSGVDQVVQFGKEQIPEVLEQLLMWHMVESLILFCISVIGIISGVYLLYKLFKYWDNELPRDECAGIFVFSSVLVFGSFLCVLNSLDWIKILIAPKLYLLEYATKLIGG